MLVIQKAIHPKYKRTYLSTMIGDKKIGFEAGTVVNVFVKGDTLFFTEKKDCPGFEFIKKAKVYFTQRRDQGQLNLGWFERNMTGKDLLRVFYTKIGIFIKPFEEKEFNEYVL